MTTIQQTIDAARLTLNDAAKARYLDSEGLLYAQDGLREACLVRPDMFSITSTVTCVAGVLQTLPLTGWFVIDVLGITGGDDITEGEYEALRRFNPSWRTETAAAATTWMRFPWDKDKGPNNQFYVSPPAINGQQLTVVYADLDVSALTLNSPVPLPEPYLPALEAYVIFRAESKDDEHVVSARAALFRTAFNQSLGVGAKSEESK